MSKIRTPISRYLHEHLVLNSRLNDCEGLSEKFDAHYAHAFHINTQALLAHGALVASLHDGFVEKVTERRIPGTNRIRTVISMSAYFYDPATRTEVGRGEVILTCEGTNRLRKLGNIQNNRIVEAVLDMDSKRLGLTLGPDWYREIIIEFAFDTVEIATRMTEQYPEHGPSDLSFLETETSGEAA